jgi:histidinol dehydrogenase
MRVLDVRKRNARISEILDRQWSIPSDVEAKTREILEAVRTKGDSAVTTFTRRFDCKCVDSLGLRVSDREFQKSYELVSDEFLKALRIAKRNIAKFHRRQCLSSWTLKEKGLRLGQRVLPLSRVGIYVPGGKAAYPSTVLMNAIPARIAGVKEIVMTTPCSAEGKISPEVLVAAAECGITEVYRIGGAQAIGAFAFGTESIRRVDKVTGPGNAYVAAAKKLVYGDVGVDMIAGPTEIVVVADHSADARFVAADLIAQAEHDENASPICLTTSRRLAEKIRAELARQLLVAERRSIAERACRNHGVIAVVRNLQHAAQIVNELAPEHLEVMVCRPKPFVEKIRNAGSIFVGTWSPEAMGDYIAGPNHTLPTSGNARFSSPLSVYDFLKFTNVIEMSQRKFETLAPHVEVLARAERLYGHAASVAIRRTR